MKKQLLSFVALLCVVWLTPTRAAAQDFVVGGIYYNITSSSYPYTVEVTKKNGIYYSGVITIPERVTSGSKNYTVTSIGDGAFKYSALTSIEIPASVTSIGEAAFSDCSRLTSIDIPASVTSIGDDAFRSCTGLTSIVVAAGNPNYDSRENCNAIIETSSNTLLQGCNTTLIPASVTSIGGGAFIGCSGLTSIEIPASVTSIGYEAFKGCSGLTSIVVAMGNPNYDSRENCNAIIETSSNTLIQGCKTTIIPNSVTSIGAYAFAFCSGLTSVFIPASLTSIGSGAFQDCSGLTKIITWATVPPTCSDNEVWYNVTCTLYVPAGSKEAYAAAEGWSYFENIEEIADDFEKDRIYYKIISSSNPLAVEVTKKDGSLYSGVITIPERVTYNDVTYSVTSIGAWAFRDCSGLTSIKIPASVTSIGSQAFYGCSGLTSIEIPSGVTSIRNYVFVGCSGLTYIEIPASVTSIGYEAFKGCSGLTSIEIPASVASIDRYAFGGCSGLTSIVVAAGNPNYDSRENCNAIIESSSNTLLQGCNTTVIPNSVTSIGEFAFEGCIGLTSIEIPAIVTSIEKFAFAGCSGLTSIEIPANVTSIGVEAFYGCSGLTSIEIPASVTSIGSLSFAHCSVLNKVISHATVPPTCSYDTWYYLNKDTCTLYVPAGSKDAYATATGWKDFINIEEFDATEITTLDAESTDTDLSDCEIYTAGGQRVDELQAGANIVRMKNGTVKKIVKR